MAVRDVTGNHEKPSSTEFVDDPIRAKAKRYQATRLRLLPLRTLAGLAFPVLVLLGPSQALAAFLGARMEAWPLIVSVYFVAFSVSYTIWLLPLNFYQGYVVERRFGLSVESAGSWFVDWLKGLLLSAFVGLPIVLAVYGLLRYAPGWWWLAAGALIVAFGVLLSNLAPVLIYPLFFKFEPIEDGEICDRLAQLVRRGGIRFSGIYRMALSAKSTEAEAMLTGIGNTRRIVLSDTLLDNYDLDETEVVLAHELGHHAKRDLPILVAVQALGTLVGMYVLSVVVKASVGRFGLTSTYDVANLPLMLAVLVGMSTLATPLGNWLSRRLEARADAFALSLTSNPAAFTSAMRKLADQNLAVLYPNPVVERLFYGHPAAGRRIKMAERFARDRGLDPAGQPPGDTAVDTLVAREVPTREADR